MMKKTRPELKSAASGRPGEGILVLSGWDLSSLEIGANVEVCVQRNQDHRYLGEQSQWVANQTWHQVSLSDESIDEVVVLALDARLVDPLVENPQMTYQVQVKIGAESGVGVMRIREGVMSSRAAGQSADPVSYVATAKRASPAVEPAPVVTEVVVDKPIPEAAPPEKRNSKVGLLIGLSALLILVAVGGFFAWKHFGVPVEPMPDTTASTPATPEVTAPVTPPVAPVVTAPVAPSAPVEPAACSAEALKASKDDLLFIQACLKTNPDTDQVLAVIGSAKDAKRCDLAQRLYAFKGQSGDVKVALAYAREFDPATFVAGCLKAADKETAIYWYEMALSKEPDNTEAKTRIEALRK